MWILTINSTVGDNIQVEVEVLVLATVRVIIWDGFLLSFELIHCNLSWLMSAIESQVTGCFLGKVRLDVCVSIEVGASTSFLLGLGLEYDTGRS